MSDFQTRVQAYVGTITATAELTNWLTAGARSLIDKMPEEKLLINASTTEVDVPNGGADMSGYRVISANKDGHGCIWLDTKFYKQLTDQNSIHYISVNSPTAIYYQGKLHVLPNGGKATCIAYPSVAYNATSISDYPVEFEHLVVLYASIQGALTKAGTAIATLAGLSFGSISTSPSAPTDASYTYSNASLGTYTATTIAATETAPEYTKPTTSVDFTNAATYIADGSDLEKAQVELSQQDGKAKQHISDINNELNEYNKETEIYKSTIQKEIEQARLDQERLMLTAGKTTDLNLQNAAQTLNAAIQLYESKMSKYLGEINMYQAEVNKEAQTYIQNIQRTSNEIQSWTILAETLQKQYDNLLRMYL